MSRINNAIELKAALEKVLDAVNKGIRNGALCTLERDIELERLRNIYEAFLSPDFLRTVSEVGDPAGLSVDLAEKNEAENIAVPDRQEEVPESVPEIQAYDNTGDVEKAGEEVLEINYAEEKQAESQATMDELTDTPFVPQPSISRDIIESLYGDSELCRKKEEPTLAVEPAEEIKLPVFETEPDEKQTVQPEKVLNETWTNGEIKDVASMLSAQSASHLRNVIGLNDRLMLMNDLFNNDSELYEKTISSLDEVDNIDDAFIYLYEHFIIDDSKEGVKLLISLLEKKFG